jgi:hypothetical protein
MIKPNHSDPNCHYPSRRSRAPLVAIALATVAIVAAASFATGYHCGAARQGRRLLDEFVVNAARLGVLDYDRLAELTDSTLQPDGSEEAHPAAGR